MATINDGTTFDPSRRIRAALGEEFSANLESEAIARLSAAMASNGTRKTSEYSEEENNMDNIRKMVNKIVHTNPKPETDTNPVGLEGKSPEEQTAIRLNTYNNTLVKFNERVSSKKGFRENASLMFTGISTKDVNLKYDIMKYVSRNLVKGMENNYMELSLRYGSVKGISITTAISGAVDFGFNALTAGNGLHVNRLFDQNVITSNEAIMIRKAIRAEKVKYAAQHALATVVIPGAVKFGIDKITNMRVKDNKVYDSLMSFCTLSEVGNIALNLIRKRAEKKAISKFNENPHTTVGSEPIAKYVDIARLATMHTINETPFNSVFSGIGGSLVGYGGVYFGESDTETVTSPIIQEYISEQPAKVEEIKPSTKKSQTTTTTKVDSVVAEKKSA